MNNKNNISEIVDKYMKGKCSREELEEALQLFEDPYHNLALRPALFNQWNENENDAQEKLKKKDRQLILSHIHQYILLNMEKQSRLDFKRKLIGNLVKVAAVLAIGIFLGLFIQYFNGTETFSYTAIAPKGSVSQMILPDNTLVYLNSGSQIKYSQNTNSHKREVYLQGEAWFEVEKNEKKPFIVHTPFYKVKVLGTQFNVKAYETDEEIVTTLEEGSIEVLSDSSNKNCKNIKLSPGQQLIFNKITKTIKTETVRTQLFTSWKDNRLIFINMNLKELIVLLERKYGVEIKTSDSGILEYHYDGTIKNETIIEVLELIKETLPIRYKIEGQNIIIQNNKEKPMTKSKN